MKTIVGGILLCVLVTAGVAMLSYKIDFPKDNKADSGEIYIKDVSSFLEDLGMPFEKEGFARNVWDMQVFDSKLYIGHGNSMNYGPNPNAGPVPIIFYDPAANEFIKPFTVNEEQIDSFKVINGKLFVPGFDSMESWHLGNFYHLDNGKWIKTRTIPNGVHVFDMAAFRGKLYVSIGSTDVSRTVYSSKDLGKTWKPVTVTKGDKYKALIGRTYNLIEFRGALYAIPMLINETADDEYNRIMVIDDTVSAIKVKKDSMLPGAPNNAMRLYRVSTAFDSLIYIAAKYNQWLPEGLFCATDINKARRIAMPERMALPADILIRKGMVYILAYKKLSNEVYTNIVYKSKDLDNWQEVFRFQYNTFARSFEELDGHFYFGMGCNADSIPETTGRILRVKAERYDADE